jgi:hypothetical protein
MRHKIRRKNSAGFGSRRAMSLTARKNVIRDWDFALSGLAAVDASPRNLLRRLENGRGAMGAEAGGGSTEGLPTKFSPINRPENSVAKPSQMPASAALNTTMQQPNPKEIRTLEKSTLLADAHSIAAPAMMGSNTRPVNLAPNRAPRKPARSDSIIRDSWPADASDGLQRMRAPSVTRSRRPPRLPVNSPGTAPTLPSGSR